MSPGLPIRHIEVTALLVLSVLLLTLAVLQYRWIGRLADAEGASRRAALEAVMGGARATLERELQSVERSLRDLLDQDGRLRLQAPPPAAVRSLTGRPAVGAVFWVAREAGGDSRPLWRLHPWPTGFESAGWAELIQHAPHFAAEIARRARPPTDPTSVPVIHIPASAGTDESDMRPGYLVAVLRVSGLQQHLSAYTTMHLERVPDAQVLLRAGGSDGSDAGAMAAGPSVERRSMTGRLHLTATFPIGSATRTAQSLRRRNLLVSAGILSLLAASVAMLWLTGRYAARTTRERLDLVAGISHELRTPLAVIRSAAANLADGVTDSPRAVREYGELLDAQGRRLEHMVEQALDLSRASTRGPRSGTESAGLSDALSSALQHVASLWSDVEIDTEVVDDLIVAVEADDLDTVLVNLLNNAAKYAEGVREVRVEVRREGRDAVVEVSNPGRALDGEERERMFEAFYRGARARSLARDGSGLGLMLVETLTRRYGGRIEASHGDGRVRFTLRLPLGTRRGTA